MDPETMRKWFLFSAILSLLLFFGNFISNAASMQDAKDLPKNHIIVYYFYSNFRCYSCYRIEQYTKEAVEKYFSSELDTGKIIFKPLNIEKEENRHFINDYQLYTKSVVLSLIKNGKETKSDNLSRVWNYLRDKECFLNYIKDEVNKYLKQIE